MGEKKARKEREKKERMERLKKLREEHENQQKKTQQELEEFVLKRDNKRYTHKYDAYPKDEQTPKQLTYASLKRLKEICPIPKFKYDAEREPILNAFGLSVTQMDCLVAYHMIDTQWNGVITKSEYVHCIKHLLKIKEWSETKIDRV